MKLLTPALGVVLLAAGLTAQTEEAAAPKTPAERADAQFESLEKEAQEIVATWRKAMREMRNKPKTEGESMPAISMRPPLKPLVAKYAAAAKEFAGTEHAPRFLVWVLQNGLQFDKKAAFEAFDTLSEHHANAPEIVRVVRMLGYMERMIGEEKVKAFRTKIEATNQSPDVKGWLALDKYGDTIKKAKTDSIEYKTARIALLAMAEKVSDKHLASELRGVIDEREKFGIGNVAPDIAGIDLDGVEFKLSDYKGKVIFLDFWGDW